MSQGPAAVLTELPGGRPRPPPLQLQARRRPSAANAAPCDADGRTPLHIAAACGADDTAALLLSSPEALNNVDVRDRGKRTALHLAAGAGHGELVKRLVAARASVHAKDEESSTPLHLAVKSGCAEVVRCLLLEQADPLAEDAQCNTPADLAKARDSDSEIAMLMVAFADRGRHRRGALQGLRRLFSPTAGARLSLAPFRKSVDGEDSRSGSSQSTPPPRRLSLTGRDATEVAHFRLHMFFSERVQMLEMEVEWRAGELPVVTAVVMGGEADRRNLQPGDRLAEIAGHCTSRRGRDELLPLLKTRPLLLKVDRSQMVNRKEPHLQLVLHPDGDDGKDFGLQVTSWGSRTVAQAVRHKSAAWTAGVLEGDVVVAIDGRDITGLATTAVRNLLKDRPQALTVRRWPAPSD